MSLTSVGNWVLSRTPSLPMAGTVPWGALEGQLDTRWEQEAMGWGRIPLRQGSNSSSGEGGQQEAQAI